jgi:sugar/nucleoside kinase (ribokinase family)
MKKYDVYAIGNALVDLEYAIDDDLLQSLALQKGVMTLVDAKEQHRILSALQDYPGKQACGGSNANTVTALSQLGGKAYYSCRVSSDEFGTFFLNDLLEQGMDSNLTIVREEGITGKCVVLVTPDAERSMFTYLGISEQVSSADLNFTAIESAHYAYIEGYLASSPTGREAAILLRKHAEKKGIKTALTFSDPNMVKYFRAALKEDLLFCNEHEALMWAETDSIDEAFEALIQTARTFVMTLGKKGAWIFNGHEKIIVPSFPVTALDTNGAGDIFAGSFLYGMTHGFSFEKAGILASLAASELVQHYGARLPKQKLVALLSHPALS